MTKEIEKIKKIIVKVLKANGVKRAGIFGSYARGEQKKNSDIDILIEFDGSLLDLVGLEIELKKVLRRDIDIVTYKGIHRLLRQRILEEEIKII